MKILLACLLLVSASVAIAGTTNIEGSYKCTGNDPFIKKDYVGTVTIAKAGQAYAVNMSFDKGDRLLGTGILNKKGKTLSIVTRDTRDTKNPGYAVTYFNIKNGGKKLEGQWTLLDSTKIADEVCERQK